jgi:hypothetical protein
LAAAAYNAGPQCVRIGLLGGERCHWRRRPTFAR